MKKTSILALLALAACGLPFYDNPQPAHAISRAWKVKWNATQDKYIKKVVKNDWNHPYREMNEWKINGKTYELKNQSDDQLTDEFRPLKANSKRQKFNKIPKDIQGHWFYANGDSFRVTRNGVIPSQRFKKLGFMQQDRYNMNIQRFTKDIIHNYTYKHDKEPEISYTFWAKTAYNYETVETGIFNHIKVRNSHGKAFSALAFYDSKGDFSLVYHKRYSKLPHKVKSVNFKDTFGYWNSPTDLAINHNKTITTKEITKINKTGKKANSEGTISKSGGGNQVIKYATKVTNDKIPAPLLSYLKTH
ncbi:hypothetical protein [Levilactobacillus enshiensis]|uniref:hypothetical protein n=1 Tax=Levilactobacillus enshiensis TaxID=2590213 RepID=UPI00117AB892|nr:hypothetical protein [Levilactobacillus enshiensis]